MTIENTVDQHNEIEKTAKELIIGVLSLDMNADEIKNSTNLYNLGLDSMNVVDLLLELERTIGFALDPEDIRPEMFEKFDKLVEFLSSKVSVAA